MTASDRQQELAADCASGGELSGKDRRESADDGRVLYGTEALCWWASAKQDQHIEVTWPGAGLAAADSMSVPNPLTSRNVPLVAPWSAALADSLPAKEARSECGAESCSTVSG